MPKILQSLIQGDFGGPDGNYEAVLREGNKLVHWFRNNTQADLKWQRAHTIVASGVAGPGSIIQSDFKTGANGDFEVIVPLSAANKGMELWHFSHDNSDISLPWKRRQMITADVAGGGCIIQSNLGNGEHGNFEVVIPLRVGRRVELWHFSRDNSLPNRPWRREQRITGANDSVGGPGTIIQSDIGGRHGHFEVVVPLIVAGGTMELWHFRHDNSNTASPWQRVRKVAANVTGPGSIIQSDFTNNEQRRFDVVVPEDGSLIHYTHNNSAANAPWVRRQKITDSATGWACLIQSSFGSGTNKNFEVLVEECKQTVMHYSHDNENVNWPWLRYRVLVGEPYPIRLTETKKVVQLTGKYEREGWNGDGDPPLNGEDNTEDTFGIRGTDLGASFEHKNRVYFLFGDTFRTVASPPLKCPSEIERELAPPDDSIAWSEDPDAADGITLNFHATAPIVCPPIAQGGFEVPMEGISVNDRMYVFFTTDHYKIGERNQMGRCVLARSDDDGVNFDLLYDLSRSKFINVSVQQRKLDGATAKQLGLAPNTIVLWIWGSGRYRSSDVYLAVMPLSNIDTGAGMKYYTGQSTALWSTNEDDAAALFCSGSVGELSVRWNPFLKRYLMLFNSPNPRGILMHSAKKPQGPWSSDPVMVFDATFGAQAGNLCAGDGYGKFIHVSWKDQECDHVQDDMFTPGQFRDNEYGGEYGPYQITRYASGVQDEWTQIYFTMSTWNPYQVMLMTTRITKDYV
jgi:hypothetical protein